MSGRSSVKVAENSSLSIKSCLIWIGLISSSTSATSSFGSIKVNNIYHLLTTVLGILSLCASVSCLCIFNHVPKKAHSFHSMPL